MISSKEEDNNRRLDIPKSTRISQTDNPKTIDIAEIYGTLTWKYI